MAIIPPTKTARHSAIAHLLRSHKISSQAQLKRCLAEQGISVTQATLSRDLLELRAMKVRTDEGGQVYALAGEGERPPLKEDHRLARLCQEVLTSVDKAANQVVLHTPPGAAHFLASAFDKSRPQGVIGTLAGDDTILLICRNEEATDETAEWLMGLCAKD